MYNYYFGKTAEYSQTKKSHLNLIKHDANLK